MFKEKIFILNAAYSSNTSRCSCINDWIWIKLFNHNVLFLKLRNANIQHQLARPFFFGQFSGGNHCLMIFCSVNVIIYNLNELKQGWRLIVMFGHKPHPFLVLLLLSFYTMKTSSLNKMIIQNLAISWGEITTRITLMCVNEQYLLIVFIRMWIYSFPDFFQNSLSSVKSANIMSAVWFMSEDYNNLSTSVVKGLYCWSDDGYL